MKKISNDIFLDVSDLESPLPLQLILKTLHENPKIEKMVVIHRLEPLGLYPHLEKLGYVYQCRPKDHLYEITIWQPF